MIQPMASHHLHHHLHLHPHPHPHPLASSVSSSSRSGLPHLWPPRTTPLLSLLPHSTTTTTTTTMKKLDSLANLSQPSSFNRHELFNNVISLLNRNEGGEVEEKKATEDHSMQADINNNVVLLRNVSHVTLAILVTGLLSCPHAWAETEIVSIEEVGNWINDLDGVKNGFISAFLLIFFSEIGDKTFFIAALLASRKSNVAVFIGTFGALVAMTFISVFLGRTFHYLDGILPLSFGENEIPLDDLAAAVLLLYFGASTLLDATSMEGSKAEEEQQEAELAVAGLGANGKESAIASTVLATFALVFVAEWGDKSFFSTIALSAASSPFGVVSGAIVGHGVATLLAVLGGSFLSTYVSEKVIAYTGGVLFLVFAAFTLFETFN